RREDRVGDDNNRRDRGDRRHVAAAVRHPGEERDDEAGPEQHRGGEDVDELERECVLDADHSGSVVGASKRIWWLPLTRRYAPTSPHRGEVEVVAQPSPKVTSRIMRRAVPSERDLVVHVAA